MTKRDSRCKRSHVSTSAYRYERKQPAYVGRARVKLSHER